jgi:hypothetical protein
MKTEEIYCLFNVISVEFSEGEEICWNPEKKCMKRFVDAKLREFNQEC